VSLCDLMVHFFGGGRRSNNY